VITERSMWTHFEGLRTKLLLTITTFYDFLTRKKSRFWNLKKPLKYVFSNSDLFRPVGRKWNGGVFFVKKVEKWKTGTFPQRRVHYVQISISYFTYLGKLGTHYRHCACWRVSKITSALTGLNAAYASNFRPSLQDQYQWRFHAGAGGHRFPQIVARPPNLAVLLTHWGQLILRKK